MSAEGGKQQGNSLGKGGVGGLGGGGIGNEGAAGNVSTLFGAFLLQSRNTAHDKSQVLMQKGLNCNVLRTVTFHELH